VEGEGGRKNAATESRNGAETDRIELEDESAGEEDGRFGEADARERSQQCLEVGGAEYENVDAGIASA